MTQRYRDLRYLRVPVDDLNAAAAFAGDVFGLQPADRDDENARFRSDARNYALCYTREKGPAAVALTVAQEEDLDVAEARLRTWTPRRLDREECRIRQIKAGLVALAPNTVSVEIVWRPLTSGWRYHGPRDAGIIGFQAVQLACADIRANEDFWVNGIGADISDWAGDAVYLRIDDAHHRIALYPSGRDGVLGATWAVESMNNVMQDWYFFQSRQIPIIHGPGRQPASNAIFVTGSGPGGIYYTYAAEIDSGPHITTRGPRQFPDTALSHCSWGSPTSAPEFLGGEDR
ncbi:VOC family protein [Rhizobium leguminosarum]